MATKQYIGSGKKHSTYDSVTVTLNMKEAEKYAFETEHGTYLTFVVTARRQADQYGKTHSVIVLVDDEGTPELPVQAEAAVAEPQPEPKKKRRSKK